MLNLCSDIGFGSMLKYGEELCGDNVEVLDGEDGSTTVVLADGMGSGVKANILSKLTAKILSTMISQGLDIEECVKTIVQTLPVCSVRQVAYSTFTVMKINPQNTEAQIIQYDNPRVILLRDGANYEFEYTEQIIEQKKILTSKVALQEGDVFILMSDGCIHAGVGTTLNFGWDRPQIVDFMEPLYYVGFTAKTLNSILLDECYKLYGGKCGDDTTACTVRIRKKEQMNLMMGPPSNRDDCDRMMSLFFSKEGKHILCGGTTSNIAAQYLGKPLYPSLDFYDPDIPPTAKLEGVDLVTEGIITINKVLTYAEDYLGENTLYKKWSVGKDGASQVARLLFEESTDINFFIGRAINPAHQNPDLPINFNIKMQLITEIAECMKKIGKRIKLNYF